MESQAPQSTGRVWQPSKTEEITPLSHQCKVTYKDKEHICLKTFPMVHSGAAQTPHLSMSALTRDRNLFCGFPIPAFPGSRCPLKPTFKQL